MVRIVRDYRLKEEDQTLVLGHINEKKHTTDTGLITEVVNPELPRKGRDPV